MDIDFIERLIGLVERSRLSELEYEEGDTRVRISRHRDTPPAQEPVREDANGTSSGRSSSPAAAPSGGLAASGLAAGEHIIAAGTIGTFFRAPAPGQPAFVSEGDRVEEGQTLAILEAMKMLNPVEADRAGRIRRILIEDGVSVAAGTPLFIIAGPD